MIRVNMTGIEDVRRLIDAVPARAKDALRMAVNEGARFGAAEGSRQIRAEFNLSRAYLGNVTDRNARLAIKQKASGDNLEAVIEARDRATSLARFSGTAPSFGKQRVKPSVRVKVGGSRRVLKSGFFVRLKKGAALSEDNYNIGLVIRMGRPGRVLNKRIMAKPFGPNLYLLYGPSVAQMFRGTSEKIAKPVAERAEREFYRQFERLTR